MQFQQIKRPILPSFQPLFTQLFYTAASSCKTKFYLFLSRSKYIIWTLLELNFSIARATLIVGKMTSVGESNTIYGQWQKKSERLRTKLSAHPHIVHVAISEANGFRFLCVQSKMDVASFYPALFLLHSNQPYFFPRMFNFLVKQRCISKFNST